MLYSPLHQETNNTVPSRIQFMSVEAEQATLGNNREDSDEFKIAQLAAVVAAAGPTSSSGSGVTSDSTGTVEDDVNSRAEDKCGGKGNTLTESGDPVTASIDRVDPLQRIAQLDRMKAEMERNFQNMKAAYGGRR